MSQLMSFVRRSCRWGLVLVCYAVLYLEDVDGQTRRPKMSRMERGGPRNSRLPTDGDNAAVTTGLKLLTYLLLAIFVPPVLIFMYNVYKDPLTVTVIKDGWEVVKSRTLGSLSKKKET